MSLLDKIEKLQKKPESYRKKLLVMLMVVFMSTIVFIWFSTINFSPDASEEWAQKSGMNYAPFSILKEAAKESVLKIKSSFNDAINQFKK